MVLGFAKRNQTTYSLATFSGGPRIPGQTDGSLQGNKKGPFELRQLFQFRDLNDICIIVSTYI